MGSKANSIQFSMAKTKKQKAPKTEKKTGGKKATTDGESSPLLTISPYLKYEFYSDVFYIRRGGKTLCVFCHEHKAGNGKKGGFKNHAAHVRRCPLATQEVFDQLVAKKFMESLNGKHVSPDEEAVEEVREEVEILNHDKMQVSETIRFLVAGVEVMTAFEEVGPEQGFENYCASQGEGTDFTTKKPVLKSAGIAEKLFSGPIANVGRFISSGLCLAPGYEVEIGLVDCNDPKKIARYNFSADSVDGVPVFKATCHGKLIAQKNSASLVSAFVIELIQLRERGHGLPQTKSFRNNGDYWCQKNIPALTEAYKYAWRRPKFQVGEEVMVEVTYPPRKNGTVKTGFWPARVERACLGNRYFVTFEDGATESEVLGTRLHNRDIALGTETNFGTTNSGQQDDQARSVGTTDPDRRKALLRCLGKIKTLVDNARERGGGRTINHNLTDRTSGKEFGNEEDFRVEVMAAIRKSISDVNIMRGDIGRIIIYVSAQQEDESKVTSLSQDSIAVNKTPRIAAYSTKDRLKAGAYLERFHEQIEHIQDTQPLHLFATYKGNSASRLSVPRKRLNQRKAVKKKSAVSPPSGLKKDCTISRSTTEKSVVAESTDEGGKAKETGGKVSEMETEIAQDPSEKETEEAVVAVPETSEENAKKSTEEKAESKVSEEVESKIVQSSEEEVPKDENLKKRKASEVVIKAEPTGSDMDDGVDYEEARKKLKIVQNGNDEVVDLT